MPFHQKCSFHLKTFAFGGIPQNHEKLLKAHPHFAFTTCATFRSTVRRSMIASEYTPPSKPDKSSEVVVSKSPVRTTNPFMENKVNPKARSICSIYKTWVKSAGRQMGWAVFRGKKCNALR